MPTVALYCRCLQDDAGSQLAGRRASVARHAADTRGGTQQTGANDADLGDEEGVTVSEYNKWLTLEENWESAEDTRQNYMEGSQFRKNRDERHRERGMERQAKSIEQMKFAKGKVEGHRELNLEQGKVRRARPQIFLPRSSQLAV